MDPPELYPCLCCGYLTLTHRPTGTYLICPICAWEDSAPDETWKHLTSNQVTLLEAQQNFLEFGASEREWIGVVRAATATDVREPGWQPIEVRIRAQRQAVLYQLDPSVTALLDWLRPHVDDALLYEIAVADYGSEANLNLRALQHIRETGDIPNMPNRPYEVLQLIRWMELEDGAVEPSLGHVRAHMMRAFCCTVLLQAGGAPHNAAYLDDEADTIIALVAGALTLGPVATRRALQLLCWRMLSLPVDNDDGPFFATGILLLAATLYDSGDDAALLSLLGGWVRAEEEQTHQLTQVEGVANVSDAWLFRLKASGSGKNAGVMYRLQRMDQWRTVARQVLLAPREPNAGTAAITLQEIGTQLVCEAA